MQSDASIKTLNNIYITSNGYLLNGTLIGYKFLDSSDVNSSFYLAPLILQINNKVYFKRGFQYSDGDILFSYQNTTADIIYV